MKKLTHYLDIIFPFAATLILWRLDSRVWNPGGILAILPIFYYSFVRPRGFFLPFAILGCFLLDYNFDTLLFWTTMFAISYGVYGFQSYLDISRQKFDGLYVFMFFFGLCLLILGAWAMAATMSLRPAPETIWLFLWVTVLYMPFVALAKKISAAPAARVTK
ncbi:MAG: hypothetical protein FWC61_00885 [Proteobacteria bacterium]|nr:hypothetical protein [Pseudomonadota bacterium]